MTAVVPAATPADVGAIGALAQEFRAYLRALGDRNYFAFTAETSRRDGFGPDAAFSGLVAERDGDVIGSRLHHFGGERQRSVLLLPSTNGKYRT